jgi:hypothetical protein
MMSVSPQVVELVEEVVAATHDARELFRELEAARARHGTGTSRDPAAIERELVHAIGDADSAGRELRDAIERDGRGMR